MMVMLDNDNLEPTGASDYDKPSLETSKRGQAQLCSSVQGQKHSTLQSAMGKNRKVHKSSNGDKRKACRVK